MVYAPYKWATREYLGRLTNRFLLMNVAQDPVINIPLANTIQPTTNVDEVLKSLSIDSVGTAARTAVQGAGKMLIHTCPLYKRQYIRALGIETASGDGTLNSMVIKCRSAATYITLASQTASVSMWISMAALGRDIILEPDDALYCHVSAITGDSTWNVMLYMQEEYAF